MSVLVTFKFVRQRSTYGKFKLESESHCEKKIILFYLKKTNVKRKL